MSTPRLTFLYPHLFRSLRSTEPATKSIRLRPRIPSRSPKSRAFSTSKRTRSKFAPRHGKAVEPIIAEGEPTEEANLDSTPVPPEEAAKLKEAKSKFREAVETEAQRAKAEKADSNAPSGPLSAETQAAAELPGYDEETGKATGVNSLWDQGKQPNTSPMQQAAVNTQEMVIPLETILEMPPPESVEDENAGKPPHLQTPPYVHHFDTYTLVKQVENGGFSEDQAITAMKAVRGLLAVNLDVAKAGLVSKSDVENETYLFRAACSELKTEISNIRKVRDETMRRERTLLQHESDILNQKLTQGLQSLRDELKGMFDDRKMNVRHEQRIMDSGIQELNYKITVGLNSDSKSEIEGLRWVLTRRSVMGILFMAFMVLTSLRLASYRSHEEEVRKKKEEGRADEQPGRFSQQHEPPGLQEILAAN